MKRQNFQTIAWFNDLNNRELLDLNPPYQRRSVWNQSYKDYFIDTILLEYPSPAIFLYEEIDESGITTSHVVDGKQRLTTIFEFINGDYAVSEKATKANLRGKYFQDLDSNIKNNFWRYTFSVEYLETNDENIINNIFDRINRNVSKLSSQELRHAKYNGEFITTCEELTTWMFETLPENSLSIYGKKQMRDVEFVSQLLLYTEEGYKYYSGDDLDKAFDKRDSEWSKKEEVVQKFKNTILKINELFTIANNQSIRNKFKNQTDFYSLFTAIQELFESLPVTQDIKNSLEKFIEVFSDEGRRESNPEILSYYDYSRAATNQVQSRKGRGEVLKKVILNQITYQ